MQFLRACEAVRVYKRKNGPISGVNLNISICSFYQFDVPNFFQNCDAMVTEFKAEVICILRGRLTSVRGRSAPYPPFLLYNGGCGVNSCAELHPNMYR